MTTKTEGPLTKVTINPFVDWGFKFLFAREETKDLLIGFLNLLLKPDDPLTDIVYLNPEVIPERPDMKRCVFDVLYRDAKGERYLIEMQKAKRTDMNNRLVYYLCRLIDQMGRHTAKWEYGMIKRVYGICLMDFIYEENPQLRHDIMLRNQDGTAYSELMNIITLQIPCLQAKSLSECKEHYEILLSLLNQTSKKMKTKEELLKEIEELNVSESSKEMFRSIVAAMNHDLTPTQLSEYLADMDEYEATMGSIGTAWKDGLKEGREAGAHEKQLEIAKSMKEHEIDIPLIMECTGLSIEEIDAL